MALIGFCAPAGGGGVLAGAARIAVAIFVLLVGLIALPIPTIQSIAKIGRRAAQGR